MFLTLKVWFSSTFRKKYKKSQKACNLKTVVKNLVRNLIILQRCAKQPAIKNFLLQLQTKQQSEWKRTLSSDVSFEFCGIFQDCICSDCFWRSFFNPFVFRFSLAVYNEKKIVQTSQLTFTCSKSTIKILEESVKSVQS